MRGARRARLYRGKGGTSDEPVSARAMRLLCWCCATALMLLGVAVLAGWVFGLQRLITVLPGYASMKPNTAFGFLLLGVALHAALWSELAGRRTAAHHVGPRILGLFAALPGLLTLIEYLGHVDLHIDQAVFLDSVQKSFPGRPAEITSVNFCLMGLALALAVGGERARRVSQALTLVVLISAFACMVGFLYGVPILYGGAGEYGSVTMALHTGVAFLVSAVGVLSLDRRSLLTLLVFGTESGSWLVRRLLPWMVLVPVAFGWLFLRPALDFGTARFGMALMTVTLAATGVAAVVILGVFLNREQGERELTAEVLAESAAAVEKSERELRLLTDQLPTQISYLSPEGVFLRVNRTYELWSGLPAGAIVGQSIRDLLGEQYWAATVAQRARVLAGEAVTFEADYPTLRGARKVQVTYVPDRDEAGPIRGFACMVLDVDEQRKAEAALRQSEKLAVVGRLASSIAHEINNPLEAVTNLLYLAEQELTDRHPAGSEAAAGDAVARYVALAQSELGRVTHIVVQTLRFHRQSTVATECRLPELAEQVLALHGGRISSAEIVVERRFLPAPPLLCREGEIRQVLANLIGNAVDAMALGGRLLVRMREGRHAAGGPCGLIVTVADTGSGMDETMRGRLFQPFHSTKGEKGSGLGLWVSKEIIDRHGGSVAMRSRRASADGTHGTVFRLFLPFLVQAEPTTADQEAAPLTTTEP